MKNLVILLILLLPMTGCVSSMVQDAIDAADERIRLKWAEEWKPDLQNELKGVVGDSKDALLEQVLSKLDSQEDKIQAKLDAVNIRLKDFDSDGDGSVTGMETLALVRELKAAKDQNGNPLSWAEILGAVVLGYGGTTAGKEWVRSRLVKNGNGHANGTGDGSRPV